MVLELSKSVLIFHSKRPWGKRVCFDWKNSSIFESTKICPKYWLLSQPDSAVNQFYRKIGPEVKHTTWLIDLVALKNLFYKGKLFRLEMNFFPLFEYSKYTISNKLWLGRRDFDTWSQYNHLTIQQLAIDNWKHSN